MRFNCVKDIVEEYELNKKHIEIPLATVKKEIEQYKNKIVLYGAGSAGIAFLHYLRDAEIFPQFFSDGDIDKHGKIVEGLEVISPESIVKKLGREALVIVTINTDGKTYCKDFKKELLEGGHQGVHKKLKELGCNNVIDYTYFRRCYQLFSGEKYNLPACSDIYQILEQQDKIEKVFSLLKNENTKSVFLKILEFRLLSDKVSIPTYSEKGMYFEYDLFPKIKDEIFIDCGACGGSSLKDFLKVNQAEFNAYYGIEPDIFNFKKLENYISNLSDSEKQKINIYNGAAYENNKGTYFYVLNGPGSFQADTGTTFINTIKIDDLLGKKNATYIKMNIEGSEVSALKGAEYTITTWKPRMAIMGYHKTSDFWEVPLLLRKFNEEYQLHLRSYMRNVAFTYYAY
ncbi:MAG: FkbM family methyltransferase [Lachnospiraceae bacterium]|nr:FkbM family methyltransferase [Lachnospiraceae bacterium]MDY4096689.1 FkbM family methyltransferase [Lachnospiraceae bacterium]